MYFKGFKSFFLFVFKAFKSYLTTIFKAFKIVSELFPKKFQSYKSFLKLCFKQKRLCRTLENTPQKAPHLNDQFPTSLAADHICHRKFANSHEHS